MSVLGDRIKKERKNLDLTREDLAKKIGVSYSAIAMYEQGHREPNNELMLKICEIFNCSMDYLMGLTSFQNPKEDLEKALYDFDLTEDEYYDAINCFMYDDVQALSFIVLFADECMAKTKEYKILLTILSYVSDYIANISLPNDKNSIDPIIRQNFEEELKKAYRPAKRLLLSLDKNKIIHNYNEITAEKKINKDRYKEKSQDLKNKYFMTPVYRSNLSWTT